MKQETWRRARHVENAFRASLYSMVNILKKVARTGGKEQEAYLKKMQNFQESEAYNKFITASVGRMVTTLATGNYSTWREAARKTTKSGIIYRALMAELKEGLQSDIREQVMQNAELIRTLPTDTARKVVVEIEKLAIQGKRATEIEKYIVGKTSQHAKASARLIARTEVSKTTTALTKARSDNLGIKWYVWRTAMDGDRVRKSHREMEGVLIRWDTPPSPELLVGEKSDGNYHPGNIWNCRCYPEPLIDVDDVKWPAKVYHNGKIKTMRKGEFERL